MVKIAVIALLLCSSLPVDGMRDNRDQDNTQESTEELELQVFGEAAQGYVKFHVGELVGFVREVRPTHGKIKSFRNQIAEVWYKNGTLETIQHQSVMDLYKPREHRYGFTGGQRVEYCGCNGNSIRNRQLGMVQAFSTDASAWAMFHDFRQKKSFRVNPNFMRAPNTCTVTCTTPTTTTIPTSSQCSDYHRMYKPKRGNCAWMPLRHVSIRVSETIKVGTQKTSKSTRTTCWSHDVTKTLKNRTMAGVNFTGASINVEVGISLKDPAKEMWIQAKSYSWMQNQETSLSVPIPRTGYLWQWQIRTELDNGQVIISKTSDVIVTKYASEKPRCLPDCHTEDWMHKTCRSDYCKILEPI